MYHLALTNQSKEAMREYFLLGTRSYEQGFFSSKIATNSQNSQPKHCCLPYLAHMEEQNIK